MALKQTVKTMENNNNVTQHQNEAEEVRTYSQEEVDAMISEATKDLLTQEKVNEIVEKRLAKANAKAEAERKQAEELAKLSAEERKAKEFEMVMAEKQAEYEEQLKAFNTMKAEFERSQLLAQVQKELAAKDLPVSCSEMLIGSDAEATMANINEFEKAFNAQMQKNIDNKLKNSSSPKIPLHESEGQTKSVKDMSLSEFIEHQKRNK
jgi:hypothetical protein